MPLFAIHPAVFYRSIQVIVSRLRQMAPNITPTSICFLAVNEGETEKNHFFLFDKRALFPIHHVRVGLSLKETKSGGKKHGRWPFSKEQRPYFPPKKAAQSIIVKNVLNSLNLIKKKTIINDPKLVRDSAYYQSPGVERKEHLCNTRAPTSTAPFPHPLTGSKTCFPPPEKVDPLSLFLLSSNIFYPIIPEEFAQQGGEESPRVIAADANHKSERRVSIFVTLRFVVAVLANSCYFIAEHLSPVSHMLIFIFSDSSLRIPAYKSQVWTQPSASRRRWPVHLQGHCLFGTIALFCYSQSYFSRHFWHNVRNTEE